MRVAFPVRALAVVSLLFTLSCDSGPTELGDLLRPDLAKGGPAKDVLVMVSGDGQTAPVGTELGRHSNDCALTTSK